MLTFRPLDVTNPDEVDRHHEVTVAASTHRRPFADPYPLETMRTLLTRPDPAQLLEPWAAFDGGEMVGAGLFEIPRLDNVTMAFVEVHVEPARRRGGIGSALLGAMLETLPERGRTVVGAAVHVPADGWQEHPYWRFATKNGFTLGNVEVHRVLDLPVDEARLRELEERAAAHHAAYRIEQFVGTIPDELLPSYCELANQLIVDAPTGELDFEAEQETPEIWKERNDILRAAGLERWSALAVAPDGRVAAFTDLVLPRAQPAVVEQWGTLVGRGDRGHRLGLAVKVRNLRELQRADPGRRRVHTSNAEVNRWMVAINEDLGFRPVELAVDVIRR